jgi:3-methyl-2-oxobutanoate hydroxymethyltransferase
VLLPFQKEEASYSKEKIAMTSSKDTNRGKITVSHLKAKKTRREPITMLTAYDYPTALILDNAGVDALLVGDSLGMVVLGYENTLPVTMEDMLHHCKAVAKGASKAHLIGDMPFMSYQVSTGEAVRNAGRFLQEGGMDAIKLEGGRERAASIKAIVSAGIPVMGHLGLTPQSVHKFGGWKTQGKSAKAALHLIEDAHILESAGCYALVLEAVPDRLAELISQRLEIPVIGIGAGVGCDGQVLVTHDILGIYQRFTPIFVKKYADLNAQITNAVKGYIHDVATRSFPASENSHPMDETAYQELLKHLGADSGKLHVAG